MNNARVSVSPPHYSLFTNDCKGIPCLINTFSSPEKHTKTMASILFDVRKEKQVAQNVLKSMK